MRSFLILVGSASLAAAHGIIDNFVIDGTTYPSYDPRLDGQFPGVKRIAWGYKKDPIVEGTGPVDDVSSPDIACRHLPLLPPAINAVARAGSNISIQWTAWFGNHKGPVITYMGYLPDEKTSVNDVEFFKIDEDGYHAKDNSWGTDALIANNNTRTVTIPSNIKPGMYVVRHEIIGLHFAWMENAAKKTSGAQPYPTCAKVRVLGTGTDSPPGQKFPGAYNWRDPGLLVNIHFHDKSYIVPGGPVYQGEKKPPQGPVPVVTETGELKGEQGEEYQKEKFEHGKRLLRSVAADIRDGKTGEGGCLWDVGDPSTIKCSEKNPNGKGYIGYAQPIGSPLYVADLPEGSFMKNRKPPPALYGNEGPNYTSPLKKSARLRM